MWRILESASRFTLLLVMAPLALLALAGCGRSTYPVEGKVVFKEDGKPLTAGVVEFLSANEDPRERVNARAEIQPDGSFQLGAVEGEHRVVVIPPLGGEQAGKPLLVDRRFSNYDQSGLRVTVTRDREQNHFTIQVERPRPPG